MDRRPFLKAFGAAAAGFTGSNLNGNKNLFKKRKIKPPRLSEGDLITLIAPGGPLTDKKIHLATQNISALGFKVKLSKNLRAKRGHMAGSDSQRLADLHSAFSDKETKAIWCVRGGDGCNRLLPDIDYRLIKRNAKALIGFSDITALISGIHRKTGLVGFHGPIGAWDFTDYNKDNLIPILVNGGNRHVIRGSEKTETIFTGKGTGELIGGNLSVLTALSGTGYDHDFKDKIVFIEDVGEKPRRIDRMLTQLRQANNLKKANGIILGEFDNCNPSKGDNSLSLIDTLKDRLINLNIPILYNFPFGHDKNLCTFPIGIEAELDAENQQITLKENAMS